MALGKIIWTYFNGTWHEGNIPIMNAADHATWLGTLVFDGARRFDGVAPDLDRHCERVNNSARTLGLTPTVTTSDMVALCTEGMDNFAGDVALYIRPMYWSVDGGPSAVLADPESTAFAICIESLPMPTPETSQTLTTTRFCRPMQSMATVDAKAACLYPNNGRMLREAISKGFNNALVADPLGNVAETATSNIFLVRDGEIFTPIPNGTFLNGITRQRAIELFRGAGQIVHESVLSFDDFRGADEVFMTGNISKVMPVSAFDETSYELGPVARRLRAAYWDWAKSTA
ncbi:MAG: branched-chain amino acid aminotransferase [Burkholderiaceae bacterium]